MEELTFYELNLIIEELKLRLLILERNNYKERLQQVKSVINKIESYLNNE